VVVSSCLGRRWKSPVAGAIDEQNVSLQPDSGADCGLTSRFTVRGSLAAALGDYYLLDWRTNAVHAKDVDPEELGRKLGVLRVWERVFDE